MVTCTMAHLSINKGIIINGSIIRKTRGKFSGLSDDFGSKISLDTTVAVGSS